MANLERYFPVVNSSSSLKQKDAKKSASRYNPYGAPTPRDVKRPSDAALNKFLLSTLKDKNNPIAHSTSESRAEHVESTATGHQRAESKINRTLYLKHRREKLKNQEARPAPATSTSALNQKSSLKTETSASSTSSTPLATGRSSSIPKGDEPPKTKKLVMQGVRVYINGYLSDTTDIEMKRTVALAGGQVLLTPSNATHILTSQGLNGSKTHKHLAKNARDKVHVVKPEWIVDSINVGKRLPERHYTVVVDRTMNSVAAMFGERPYERPLPPSP